MFLAIAIGFSPAFVPDAKADDGQDVETQADSWRYSDGQIICDDGAEGENAPDADYNAQMGLQSEEETDEAVEGETTEGESQESEVTEEGTDAELQLQSGKYWGDRGPGELKGIDVSYWQHTIDWRKVKAAGIDFAIIRCGYGSNTTSNDDSCFKKNVQGCIDNGIPYGVYFYSYAGSESAAADEARHALRLLDGLHPDLPVYYDLEDRTVANAGSTMIRKVGNKFCSMLEQEGYRAGVYASLSWWDDKLGSSLDAYDKWIAQWNSTCTYKRTYTIWQCKSTATVSGISGYVDANLIKYKSGLDKTMSGAYTVPRGAITDISDFRGYLCHNITSKKGPGKAYYSGDYFKYREKVTVTRKSGDYYEITRAETPAPGSGSWVPKSAIALSSTPYGFVPDSESNAENPPYVLVSYDGNVIKGNKWVTVKGKVYFVDERGCALKGWQKTAALGNKDYYFDEKTGQACSYVLRTINGRKYYLGKNGIILKSFLKTIDGYVRGFGPDGAMVTGRSAWIGYKCYTYDGYGRAYLNRSKTKKKATIYAKAGSVKKGTLKKGKSFYVLRTSGKWSQMANGLWIKTSYTKKTAVYPTIKPSKNIRYTTKMKKKTKSYSGPSSSYIKKKTLKKNKKVTVVGTYGSWAKLTTDTWVPKSRLK